MKSVIGMGNALVDILVPVDNDNLLKDLGLEKGSMQLVDKLFSDNILEKLKDLSSSLVSGGSASNTIHGLSRLGVKTAFIGKVSEDEYGDIFCKDLEKNNIECKLFKGEPATGRAIAIISPDSERTFATYLGSAVNLTAPEITPEIFEGYDFFHIEGYLVQNHKLLEKALRTAKNRGLTVSLDLASFNIVRENLEFLQVMVHKYVDVLFANEEESLVFTGKNCEEAVSGMGKMCEVAVVKTGAKGSLVCQKNNVIRIESVASKPVDTTGAGDLYASGFIYGLINGKDIPECGNIGSLLAGNVIETIGAKIPENKWEEIIEKMRKL
jgi:sugar/nucleoside kinase (ribokinase family)